MKKIILAALILIAFLGSFKGLHAQNLPSKPGPSGCPEGQILNLERKCVSNQNYVLLAPINVEGGITEFDPAQEGALGKYLNLMIKIIIGLSGVMAVMMFVIGGIEYMTSELVHSKESAKSRMTGAVLGLVIALGAYALLNTINPDLLNTDLKIENAKITVSLGGESSEPFKPINPIALQKLGINCPGSGGKSSLESIGQQFIGKSTYSQSARNTYNESSVFLDCSSFVAQVYTCAGLGSPGGNTNTIFSTGGANTRQVNGATFDFSTLHVGDLIGWKPSDDKNGDGHVMIYLGGGKIMDASSTAGGVQVRSINTIKDRVTYVKWP